MTLSRLPRHFNLLSRYIYHAAAWCQVLFHAVRVVACQLALWHVVCCSELSRSVLFSHMLCCHIWFSPVCSCYCTPYRVVTAWFCVCHLLRLCAVRGYQVPSYVAAGINIWECIFLIAIFKSQWKDSRGDTWSLEDDEKNFPGPAEAVVRACGCSLCPTGWCYTSSCPTLHP